MENKKIVKLGDLCKKVKNGASSFYLKEGTVPLKFIRHADVGDDGIINAASAEEVKARDSARTFENLLKAGDVLVAIRGPAKVAVVPPEADGYSFSAEFVALEIDTDKISPEIVAGYLRLPHVNSYLEGKSPTKTMRSISIKDLQDLQLHVPELEVQNTIIELLSLIGEKEQVMKEELKKLTELKHSLMMKMIGGNNS